MIALCFVVVAFGMFLAGHLVIVEVPIEMLLICAIFWLILTPRTEWPTPEYSRFSTALGLILRFKEKNFNEFLSGGRKVAVAKIIFFGIAAGWGITLLGGLVSDASSVFAREIKESILDILVFLPFFIIINSVLLQFSKNGPKAQDLRVMLDKPPASDSEAIQRWLDASNRVLIAAQEQGRGFKIVLLTLGLGSLGPFILGLVLGTLFPVGFLDFVRKWQL